MIRTIIPTARHVTSVTRASLLPVPFLELRPDRLVVLCHLPSVVSLVHNVEVVLEVALVVVVESLLDAFLPLLLRAAQELCGRCRRVAER